jgi:predicted lipid-binding transport protein (Tim44 family)
MTTDALIFLFITIFFIIKLKNVIGTRSEDDEIRKKAAEEFFRQKNQEKFQPQTIDITETVVKEKPEKKELGLDFEVTSETIQRLSKIDFDQDNFLNGAESAIEMIIEAFSTKDIKTLEELMSKDVYLNFKKQMDDLINQDKNLKSSLVAVLSKKITNITSTTRNILIDVLFDMEQINFVLNNRGEVIFGSKKQIQKVKEEWTFERSITSKDNFWIVKNITAK